eukprot:2160060-Prymnesium_polylepis.1
MSTMRRWCAFASTEQSRRLGCIRGRMFGPMTRKVLRRLKLPASALETEGHVDHRAVTKRAQHAGAAIAHGVSAHSTIQAVHAARPHCSYFGPLPSFVQAFHVIDGDVMRSVVGGLQTRQESLNGVRLSEAHSGARTSLQEEDNDEQQHVQQVLDEAANHARSLHAQLQYLELVADVKVAIHVELLRSIEFGIPSPPDLHVAGSLRVREEHKERLVRSPVGLDFVHLEDHSPGAESRLSRR